jgi:hypothetical protein
VLFAGGGFRHGKHLAFVRERNYPLPNLFVNILQRFGIEADHFASSTGAIRGKVFASQIRHRESREPARPPTTPRTAVKIVPRTRLHNFVFAAAPNPPHKSINAKIILPLAFDAPPSV